MTKPKQERHLRVPQELSLILEHDGITLPPEVRAHLEVRSRQHVYLVAGGEPGTWRLMGPAAYAAHSEQEGKRLQEARECLDGAARWLRRAEEEDLHEAVYLLEDVARALCEAVLRRHGHADPQDWLSRLTAAAISATAPAERLIAPLAETIVHAAREVYAARGGPTSKTTRSYLRRARQAILRLRLTWSDRSPDKESHHD